MKPEKNLESKYKWPIVIISILVPVAVAVLFFTTKIDGYDTSFLPPIYATMNGLTAIFLVLGIIAIKRKNMALHRKLMTSAIAFSAIFLLLYVVYHSTSESTPFGGQGTIRTFYFILLISHIILSVFIIPLVLITYVRALSQRFDKHKKIARITFPLWLYVAVSGVLVYLLISPYYV
jgi:putative membrane protein